MKLVLLGVFPKSTLGSFLHLVAQCPGEYNSVNASFSVNDTSATF
jgi:hypothetical protein